MKEYMRLESDSIGTMEVPEDAYYGVQALRAKENFPITGTLLHPVFIKNLAKIKRAAAITNRKAGRLKPEIANAIESACNEVVCGMFDKEFIVDGIQGGAGTSANMNMNEVIARINELAKKAKAGALTPEEVQERDKLRRIYIDSVKANLVGQLENTYILEPDGTKKKVTKK